VATARKMSESWPSTAAGRRSDRESEHRANGVRGRVCQGPLPAATRTSPSQNDGRDRGVDDMPGRTEPRSPGVRIRAGVFGERSWLCR
jgi:hypothetical protein